MLYVQKHITVEHIEYKHTNLVFTRLNIFVDKYDIKDLLLEVSKSVNSNTIIISCLLPPLL